MQNENKNEVLEEEIVQEEVVVEECVEYEYKEPNKVLLALKAIGNFLLDILLRVVFVFRDLGLAVWNGIKGIGKAIVKFGKRFKNGSIWTKLSHFIMGAGNLARGQIVKGLIFLIIEVGFILFLTLSPTFRDIPMGAKGIENFFELGDYHGMSIDDDYDFTSEYQSINSTYNFHDESYDDYEAKAYRFKQIFLAIDNVAEGITKEFNEEKQEDKRYDKLDEEYYPYYEYEDFNYVIRDNRKNGVSDLYGLLETKIGNLNTSAQTAFDKYDALLAEYSSIDADDSLDQYEKEDAKIALARTLSKYIEDNTTFVRSKDYIYLYSPTELSFNDVNSMFTIKTYSYIARELKLEDTTENIHIFRANEKHTYKGQEMYVYMIFNETEGANQILLFNGLNENVEVRLISYHKDTVNVEVDNSFLILLFGVVTFAIIGIFLLIYNVSIDSSVKADNDIKEGKKPTTFIEDLKTLLDSRFHLTLLGPAILFLIVFTIVPTILMILIAFTNATTPTAIGGEELIKWTYFTNFIDLFSGTSTGGSQIANEVGKNFGSVILWTFEWAIVATFSCYFGGIFLAILINKKDVKGKKLWRTIFILTIAIPQFISLLVMKSLLNEFGPINTMLKDLGWIEKGIDFLQVTTIETADMGKVWMARGTVLLINLYIGIPYTMLMTSGILMNIPKDLYEAATIDGANKFQMFRKITLPYVIFVTTPYLISSFIGNMTSFNTIFLTTGGGPGIPGSMSAGHTDLLVTWLFKLTMSDRTLYNAGSIIGILTFLITAFLTLVCYRNSKAYKEEDTFQ